jgi:hypothetical protein
MICLTGDLHHMGLGTGNQQHSDISELRTAQLYLERLRQAGVKVTFFVSGRCCVDEWEDLAPIATDPLVELGGHNYNCFQPELWHRVWNKLIGSYNGPRWYQDLDTRRTIAAIRRRTGKTIRLWRNHMYMHGPYTESVLAKNGIALISDGVKKATPGPVWDDRGLWSFPINVIPDHEHIYHAERTREWVAWWQKRYQWSDDFGPESYEVDTWAEMVIAQVRDNEARGTISNLIIHPITMYLADRFISAQRIIDYLATLECVHLSEVIPPVPSPERTSRAGPTP